MEFRVEAIHVLFWLYFAHVLRFSVKLILKEMGLLIWKKKVSSQHGIQVWSLVLLVVLIQSYCDNQEQKVEKKYLENEDLKGESQTWAKDATVVKDITATKEILKNLPRDNKKNDLRASENLATLHSPEVQESKSNLIRQDP